MVLASLLTLFWVRRYGASYCAGPATSSFGVLTVAPGAVPVQAKKKPRGTNTRWKRVRTEKKSGAAAAPRVKPVSRLRDPGEALGGGNEARLADAAAPSR